MLAQSCFIASRTPMLLKVTADQLRDLVCWRIIDDHAEFRPAVDGEGGEFELEQGELGMTDALQPLAVPHDIIVAPEPMELRARAGEFVDEVRELASALMVEIPGK